MLAIMLTSTASLFLASTALVSFGLYRFHATTDAQITSIAKLLSLNLTSALIFDDPDAARATLAALRERQDAELAVAYDAQGEIFATYQNSDQFAGQVPQRAEIPSIFQTGNSIRIFHPITNDGVPVGTLYLQFDLSEQLARIRNYAIIVTVTLLGSLLVALGLSRKLQEVIGDPLVGLAKVAKRIRMEKDFSIRAPKQSGDEVGSLVESFNELLEHTERSEAELRHSEELFRALSAHSPIGIFRLDLKGQPVYLNPAGEKILGAKLPVVRTSDWVKILHPDDRDRVLSQWKQYQAGGESFLEEFRLVYPDGRLQWIEARGTPLLSDTNERIAHVGTLRDVTARRRAEDALRDSEERFRQLSESIREVFWLTDADHTQTIYISPAYEEIWGRSCASLYASPNDWLDAIHPEDRQRVDEAVQKQREDNYDVEYRIVRPSGSVRWIRDRAFPVVDEKGRVYRMAGISEDITELKGVQNALRLESEITRNIQEGVSLVRVSDGVIVYCNARFDVLFGYPPGELIGKPVSILNSPVGKGAEQTVREIMEILTATGSWRGEVLNRRKDGTDFWSFASVSQYQHPQHGTVWVSVQADITRRKQTEQALQEREEQLRAIVGSAPVVLFANDKDGVILLEEGLPLQRLGGKSGQNVGRHITEAYGNVPVLLENFNRALAGEDFTTDVAIGNVLFEIRYGPRYGADGLIIGVIGVATDVTERRSAEQMLDRYFELSLDLLAIANFDGYFVKISKSWQRVLGHSLDTLTNAPFLEFTHPDDREATVGELGRAIQGKTVFGFHNRYRRTDGTYRWFEWSAIPVQATRLIYAAARDITEVRRMEEEILHIADREQMRLGQDLHDGLGQHLVGTAYAIKSLEEQLRANSQPGVEQAGKIRQLVEAAIRQARDIARGLYPVDLGEGGLAGAFHNLATNVENIFQVHCHINCDPRVVVANLDVATQLYRIAQEAVNNAARHGQARHIWIWLGPRKDKVMLSIRDNGVGIPDSRGGNSGMGIHLMNYRARMIGGTLVIQQHPEGGTIVTCTFQNPTA